jgi:hypothetical protein
VEKFPKFCNAKFERTPKTIADRDLDETSVDPSEGFGSRQFQHEIVSFDEVVDFKLILPLDFGRRRINPKPKSVEEFILFR